MAVKRTLSSRTPFLANVLVPGRSSRHRHFFFLLKEPSLEKASENFVWTYSPKNLGFRTSLSLPKLILSFLFTLCVEESKPQISLWYEQKPPIPSTENRFQALEVPVDSPEMIAKVKLEVFV